MCDKTYTIGELAALAGISVRALRHYDQIGLLKPHRQANDYRIYRRQDVETLQQIMAMKACGLSLGDIRYILMEPDANIAAKLVTHIQTLKAQADSIGLALQNTKRALALIEGMEEMNDSQRFDELKKQTINAFEETYGQEARSLYGDEAIDATNQKLIAMSEDEWEIKELLEDAIKIQLRLARATGDPASAEARELVAMHKHWVRIHWGSRTLDEDAYKSMAQGYLNDPRFIQYYDGAAGQGATEFLVNAILCDGDL